jgi:hypothetical protein
VDKVQVADGGIEKALKGGSADALDGPSRGEAAVVGAGAARPGAREDDEDDADEEQVSLAPDATGRDKEDGGRARAEEEVPRQEGDAREGLAKETGYGEGVGGEDGAEGCREDGGEAEEEGDQVAPPKGPVEGVVWIIGRLGVLRWSR